MYGKIPKTKPIITVKSVFFRKERIIIIPPIIKYNILNTFLRDNKRAKTK